VWCSLNHAVGEGEYDVIVLEPSTLSPTAAEDFPRWLDLPQDMGETWEPRLRRPGGGGAVGPPDSNLVETKAGGRPAWTQPADWPGCS
jgi:hypothetical protein